MKRLLNIVAISTLVGGNLFGIVWAQNAPDAKYMLPGTAEYYRNAANDALTARSYALQCVDEYAQLKAKIPDYPIDPDCLSC